MKIEFDVDRTKSKKYPHAYCEGYTLKVPSSALKRENDKFLKATIKQHFGSISKRIILVKTYDNEEEIGVYSIPESKEVAVVQMLIDIHEAKKLQSRVNDNEQMNFPQAILEDYYFGYSGSDLFEGKAWIYLIYGFTGFGFRESFD